MGKSAMLVDIDAISLLQDAAQQFAPARPPAEAEPVQKKPTRPVVLTPTPTKKKGARDGRDAMLSDYLSSLGRIALLTAEQEISLAKTLLDLEIKCWTRLLNVHGVAAHVQASGVDTTAIPADALARLVSGGKAPKDIADVATALRLADDSRSLVDATIASVHERAPSVAKELQAVRRAALQTRNRFVRANLRLVVSVARRFHHYRLPLIDLIQEGNLGLIKSVHRYDHTKGFRFSTYAHWWIRQAIERAIMNKGAQVRLPVHMFDARRELQKVTRDLQRSLGRDPSYQELAAGLGVGLAKLHEIMCAVPRDPVSLDDAVGDDEDRTLGEMTSDADAVSPDDKVIAAAERHWVRRVLMRLTPMEVDILVRRFGIGTDEDETLEEIGVTYNLSRERVRQIQVASLKKMQRYAQKAVG